MNDRLATVSLEDVIRARLHQAESESAESLAKADPRRCFVVGDLAVERAHPRGVEVSRPQAKRLVRGLACPAEQPRTAHPRRVTIQVGQERKHVAYRSVDRRPRLVPNGGAASPRHLVTASRVLVDSLDMTRSGRVS